MSFKKNIFYNVSLSVLNVLFPIVTAPYISRMLGVENIGVVRFVTTCVGYFALFAALGIGYYGVRELAKHKDDQEKCSQLFSSLFTITLCSTLVVTLFFLLSVNFVPAFKEHRLLFSLYGITLYLVPITMDWYFQAKENFKMITIRSFVVKLLAFASLFIFVRERSDIVPYLLISTFSIVATQIWNLYYACKTGLRISLRHLKLRQHVTPMLIFLWANIAMSIYLMLNTVMLGFLSSYEQVGYFASPSIVLSAMYSMIAAMSIAALPRLSFNNMQKNDTSNADLLQKMFDIYALLVIPMNVGMYLAASHFVPFFFGNEFMGSIVPMQILSFKMIIASTNHFFANNILMAFGHEKKFLLAVAGTAILAVVFNFLLIPLYGAIGAAIVSVIAEVFLLILLLYFVYKSTKVRMHWDSMGIATAFSLPFFVLRYVCDKFIDNSMLFLCVFIFLSVVAYFMLQLMAKNYLVKQVVEIGVNKLKNKNK